MSSIKLDQSSILAPPHDDSFDSPILLKKVKTSQNGFLHHNKSQVRGNSNNYPKIT